MDDRSRDVRPDRYPLSLEQEKLWLTEARGFGAEGHANVAAMRITGPLLTADLEHAVGVVLARHEALSIAVTEVAGRVYQLRGARPPRVASEDLRALPDAWFQALLRARALADEPLDVRDGVCRATIVRVAEHDHLLVLIMHMLVSDGASLGILFEDVLAVLRARRRGAAAELAPAGSPLEYAREQRERAAPGDDRVGYWVDRLAGHGLVARLPYDGDPGDGSDVRGFVADCRLSSDEAAVVSRFAAERRVTRFAVTLASFGLALHALTGQRTVVIPAPVSTRDERTQRLVGHFLNTVPYRLDLGDVCTFDAAVSAANAAIWDGWPHRFAPFQNVIARLASHRAAEPSLRPNVMLAQNTAPLAPVRIDDLVCVPIALPNRTSKFDVALIAAETGDWNTRVTVRSAALTASSAARIAALYRTILARGAAAPERAAEQLWSAEPPVSIARPDTNPFTSFPDAVESAASRHPDALAIDDGMTALTYRELAGRVRAADARLRESGVGPGATVLLAADRVASTYVAYLAILRAGAVVVPFDPQWPTWRLDVVVEDCAPAVIVAGAAPTALAGTARVLERDALVAPGPHDQPARAVARDDPAYVIFTSGTTGRPKGAVLPHRALMNLATADRGTIKLRPGDRVAQFAPLVVDASVWDIVASLVAGATLVVVRDGVRADAAKLSEFLTNRGISVVKATPTTLVTIAEPVAETLRVVISAGEPCPRALATRWPARVEFFNAYGPTEAGVWATLERFGGTWRENVEIGAAVPGVSVSVRTPSGRVVDDGCAGELCIAGEGVGLGYLRSDELTRERFRSDGAGLCYRSGDLGRVLADGRFELFGRADRQIKLRGNRIQLEEVELVLLESSHVLHAAVVAEPDGRPERLIAFVELREAAGDDTLIRHLRQKLPDTMLPAKFVRVPNWPLTAGGKTDLGALRDRARAELSPESANVRFYRVIWEPNGRSPDRSRGDACVLVTDDAPLAARIAGASDGMMCDIVALHAAPGVPHEPKTLAAALLSLACGRPEVRLAIVSAEPPALASLLPFGLAAVELAGRVRLDITVITSGGFRVDPGDAVRPLARAAAAFVKVVPQESADVRTRLVDLGPAVDADALASQVADAVSICAGTPAGTILAYRDGSALRRRCVEVAAPDRGRPAFALRERGVYVLIGGFGGIARALALRLARDHRARLVLAGRGAPARAPGAPWADGRDAEAGRFVERLESHGSEVLVVPCDCANPGDVDALVAAARSAFGRIDGVLHCAGVGSPASFPQLGAEVIARVMRPKNDGTRVLLDRLPLHDLDFMVTMSSTASFLGGFGSMAYTAANLVQEAHAERAAANVLTIGWGRWIESGMAARADVPADLGAALAERLKHGIDDDAGYRAFVAALALGPGLLYATAERLPNYEPAGASTAVGPPGGAARAGSEVPTRSRPAIDAPFRPARSALEAWLVRRFEEVLHVDGIGIEDDVFALGGHSLNAARLAGMLSEDFEVDVSLAAVFRYPSVRMLAESIAARAGDPAKLAAIAETYLYVAALPDGGGAVLATAE